jgi:hypothetical protein
MDDWTTDLPKPRAGEGGPKGESMVLPGFVFPPDGIVSPKRPNHGTRLTPAPGPKDQGPGGAVWGATRLGVGCNPAASATGSPRKIG